MHFATNIGHTLALSVVGLAATPSPAPVEPPDELVTPGFTGFAIMVVLVVAVIVLVWDMQRRIRRTRYRQEIDERLDAEARGGEQAARDDAEAAGGRAEGDNPDGEEPGAAGRRGDQAL